MPEVVKQYLRYAGILRRYGIWDVREYFRLVSPVNPVRILDLLPFEPKTILDIGANRGDWTERFVSLLGISADFYLVEPIEKLAGALEERFQGLRNVKVSRLALTNRCGAQTINVATSDDFSSLEEFGPALADRRVGVQRQEEVPVATLDEYRNTIGLGRVDLIKIDVQGHELKVLAGGKKTLENARAILVEWNIVNLYGSDATFIKVHQALEEHDFSLVGIPYQYRENGRLLYGDALYLQARLLKQET